MSFSSGTISPGRSMTLTPEKAIPDKYDNALFGYFQQKITGLSKLKKPFVYFAVGSANTNANGTFSSGDIDRKALLEQQSPKKLLAETSEKGYQNVVINIDNCDDDGFFNGLFPLAGRANPSGEAKSLTVIADYFTRVMQMGGFVLMVNAVCDFPAEITNPESPREPSFYLFDGMEKLMRMISASLKPRNFAYASAYLAERKYYNLYKPALLGSTSSEFYYSLGLEHLTIDELTETPGCNKSI